MDTRNVKSYSFERFRSVLTDLHFWVPLSVLVAGLFLLASLQQR